MVHEPAALNGTTLVQGLLQSVEYEGGMGGPEERLHRLKGRSSSAITKYALAFRRISLA